MRWLKKRGSGEVWPWTEVLSRRSDMEEVEVSAKRSKLAKADENDGDEKPPADSVTKVDPTDGEVSLDAYSITDKAELRKLLKAKGITLANNASLKKLQDALAESEAE